MGDLKHCYNCMDEYDAELHVCPHCGYDENTPHNPMYITPGTLLHEKYLCGILLEFNGILIVIRHEVGKTGVGGEGL